MTEVFSEKGYLLSFKVSIAVAHELSSKVLFCVVGFRRLRFLFKKTKIPEGFKRKRRASQKKSSYSNKFTEFFFLQTRKILVSAIKQEHEEGSSSFILARQ